MAIKLKVQESSAKLKVGQGDNAKLRASDGVPMYENN